MDLAELAYKIEEWEETLRLHLSQNPLDDVIEAVIDDMATVNAEINEEIL